MPMRSVRNCFASRNQWSSLANLRKVEPPMASCSKHTAAADAVDFLLLLQNLKTTKRTGWVRKNVHQPESIADHMYRMGMMALVAGDCGVDSTRCIKIALVHDVAEAVVGDITPHDPVTKEEKHALEKAAVQDIKKLLGGETLAAQEVEALWQEYEDAETPEARLVKDFDKLEMIVQAFEYETAQGINLQEFFDSTEGRFQTPTGKAWAAELLARRSSRKEHSTAQQDEQLQQGDSKRPKLEEAAAAPDAAGRT